MLQQELLIGTVLTLAADMAAAVNGVTLRHPEAEAFFREDQPSYLFAYARREVWRQR